MVLVSVNGNMRKVRLARRAREWLVAICTAYDSGPEKEAILTSAAIGVYLCDALDDIAPNQESLKVIRRLRAHIEKASSSAYGLGCSQLLLTQCILSHYGYPSEILSTFAVSAAKSLVNQDAQQLFEYVTNGLLLFRLGLNSTPPEPVITTIADTNSNALALLLADVNGLRQFCDRIALATVFGYSKASEETFGVAAQILPPIAMQRLRMYDLEIGAMLLRAMLYLGLGKSQVAQVGLRFLEFQQCSNGAFGYYAIALNRGKTSQHKSAILRLCLSTTTACLWTIAEFSIPGFRLFWGYLPTF